ncbi:MAG TPA: 2Fe-2S iron-sulfur cluster binding domain-containing protein [Pseudonocardiaceae bacterium]
MDTAVESYDITLTTTDGERLEFACASGQSVLDAAADAGMTLPASCRQGTCGSCHATVTDGEYELGVCDPRALPADERDHQGVLLCQTFPHGCLAAALPYDGSRILYGGIPERQGVITALEPVARETVRLELQVEPDEAAGAGCEFDAGQFMEIQVPGTDAKRAYSLANTGNWEGRLEFFIRLRPGGLFSGYLRDEAKLGARLTVLGPQGAFGLRENGLRPRWFVAGGTGLAPLLAMARRMAEWADPQPARLFLGVNEEADVFGVPELEAVASDLPGFRFDVCVWRPGPAWPGRAVTPADALAAALADEPVRPDIYICGPPPLIDAVMDAATAADVPADHLLYERFLPT